MNSLTQKMMTVEQELAAEHGEFTLFALFTSFPSCGDCESIPKLVRKTIIRNKESMAYSLFSSIFNDCSQYFHSLSRLGRHLFSSITLIFNRNYSSCKP
ncbi:MAG: hypothetical protein NTV43_14950 [Methylococcales bacterium]|nr:hypothetical protein [Methylococcales bacterium]